MAAIATAGVLVGIIKLRQARQDAAALAMRLESIKPAAGHEHSDVRQFMIRQELLRAGPVVVIGDSLMEAAPLSRTICGYTVVNAGIGGANARFTSETIESLLAGVAPAAIVIAIGTNDAHPVPDAIAEFRKTYRALLQRAVRLAPRVAVATVPTIAEDGSLTRAGGFAPALVDGFNTEIRSLARSNGADLIDLNEAIDQAAVRAPTIDGVHLSQRAYDAWVTTLQAGIRKSMGCGVQSSGN